MAVNASESWQSEIAFGTPGTGWGTPGTVDTRLDDHDDPTMLMVPVYVPRTGSRGTRNEYRATVGGKATQGDINNFVATPNIMAKVLHLSMGTRVGSAITLVEGNIPIFTMQQNRAGIQGYTYAGCKISSLSMSYVPNEHVKCSWMVVAKKEIETAVGALTAVSYDTESPYQFYEVTMTLDGVERQLYGLDFTLDNQLFYPEFTSGDQFPKCPGEGVRLITGTFSRELIGQELYNKFQSGALAKIVASASNGTDTMILTWDTVQYREFTREEGEQKETTSIGWTAVSADDEVTPQMSAVVTTS